jgi:A/G-specific adenine glycosylase
MDPYRVWLSEVMLQQTTVPAAIPYFEAFTRRWPSVQALAAARDEDVMAAWAGLGYYARARNMLCAARAVAAAGGTFPADEGALRALPGVGAYTAAAVRAFAFGLPAAPVDANVERVMARWGAVEVPFPAGKAQAHALARHLAEGRADRPGDFAAALMDLGSGVCRPRGPECGACPVAGSCLGRARGIAADLPRRAPKAPRPLRHGHVYWVEEGGLVLVHRRPARGLLGGMLGLPTSAWGPGPQAHPAFLAPVGEGLAPVRHVFTHFSLVLTPWRARLTGPVPEGHAWAPPPAAPDMPTVFAKAVGRFSAPGLFTKFDGTAAATVS